MDLFELEAVSNSDLERYAEFLGLSGDDAGLFYVTYYEEADEEG